MDGEQGKQEWLKLCEQAAVEQDPEKLLVLTQQICRLLEERENALKKQGCSGEVNTSLDQATLAE